jgi:hypothetical protein
LTGQRCKANDARRIPDSIEMRERLPRRKQDGYPETSQEPAISTLASLDLRQIADALSETRFVYVNVASPSLSGLFAPLAPNWRGKICC